MAASTSPSLFLHEEEGDQEEEDEPNNKLQSLLNESDSLILSCLRRKAREDKNFLFWDFSPSDDDDTEENEVYEPVFESEAEPNRESPLVQITLYANGYSMKLLVPSNGNNGRNGDSGNEEVFLSYEDSFNSESGLVEFLDSGLTPPALFDLLQLRFPERINQIECRYGQEVEVLVKDHRHINPESLSQNKDFLTIDTQVRLKSSDVTTMKVIRQKIVTLNHEKRRLNLNIVQEETSKGKVKNSVPNHDDPSGSNNNEPKPKAKRKRKMTSAKNLDATPEEIESQVIFDCSEPLCLDPSPIVCLIENKLVQSSRFIQSSSELMKFTARNMIKHNRYINKKIKQTSATKIKREGGNTTDEDDQSNDEFAPLNPAECLTDFLSRRSDSRTPASVRASKRCKTVIGSGDYILNSDSQRMSDIDKTYSEISKIASRKALASSLMNRNFTDNSLIKVEEYLMEFDIHQNLPPLNTGNTVQQQLAPPSHGMTAVSIFHRPIDDTFFGQLFVDRAGLSISDRSNWNEALRTSSSSRSCLFKLGSRENAKAYLEQFTEILSENGRKSVRITRSGVGAGIPQIQQQQQRQNPQTSSSQPSPQQQAVQNQQQAPQQQQTPQSGPNVQNPHQVQQQHIHNMQQSHQMPVAVGPSNIPVATKVQLQPIQASNVQVIHPASMGTKVILPAPVQQIQPIPSTATAQQQQQHQHHTAQIIPTPIAPAPTQSTVQIKTQQNTLGNVSLCSLLQQPIQVVQSNPVTQVPAPSAMISTPITVSNQIQQPSQLNQQQQQQLIQTLHQQSNPHLTAALEASQMRPGQSWIVLPPNNLTPKNVTNTGIIGPSVAGQGVSAVPVSQGVNQTFRPFQVILWPQQQQQTLNVQPMIQAQHVHTTPTSNGPVTMTLTHAQQQQIQNQIQQQQLNQHQQQQQQQSHP